jgi:transposase
LWKAKSAHRGPCSRNVSTITWKDNGKAIRNVCRQFVVLCQQLDLFSDAVVAINGSKFKAVNSSDRNFTSAKLKRRMEEIEANISRYLAELDTADRQEPAAAKSRVARLEARVAQVLSATTCRPQSMPSTI